MLVVVEEVVKLNKKFITVRFKETKSSGAYSKARQDIDTVLLKMGFEPVEISFTFIVNRFLRKTKLAYVYESFIAILEWIKVYHRINREDILLYQHPMVATPIVYFFLKMLKKRKNIKLLILIHDLYSLRAGEKNTKAILKDEKILALADVITCHNNSMMNEMIKMGRDESKLLPLGIFDYLLDEEPKVVPNLVEGVIIAGLLDRNKSEYLYHLDELQGTCKFNLFGLYFSGQGMYTKDQVEYHGSFPANELHKHLRGGFGLVWDGTSTKTCAGTVGQYLKYNNPHKASAYLAAGFPLIVWDESALADFVENNGIGICVSSLQDMEKKVTALTDGDYEKMVKNAKFIGEKIRNGYFTKKVVDSMIKQV